MNISPYSATNPELLFLNFNQDCGCFVAGTEKGFRIFNTDPLRHKSVHPMDQMGVDEDTETTSGSTPGTKSGHLKGVILAEMLFRCNYVALVFGHRPNCVRIWDDLKTRFVTDLEFNTPVKAVKLRRDRIVVVTQELIKVRHTKRVKNLQKFFILAFLFFYLCNHDARLFVTYPKKNCTIEN